MAENKRGKGGSKGNGKDGGVFAIPPLNLEFLEVKVRGIPGSALVTNAMGAKLYQEMIDRGQNKTKAKSQARPKRDPEQEFREALYLIPGEEDSYGLPASGFKKAMCTVAKDIPGKDINATAMMRQVFVMADVGRYVRIKSKSGPKMREDIVRIGPKKTPDLRYRPEFEDWEAKLVIRYDADLYSWESIIHLLARAGATVGWGEMRPEKGYECGMFEIVGEPVVRRAA